MTKKPISKVKIRELKALGSVGEMLIGVCPKHLMNKSNVSEGGKGTLKPLVPSEIPRHVVQDTEGMLTEVEYRGLMKHMTSKIVL